jgi:hypothetical protein
MRLVDVNHWLRRVFLWDGIVPTAVSGSVHLMSVCFQKNSIVPVLGGIAIIIAAFWIRLGIAGRYFDTHPHYSWQVTVAFCAMLYLIFCESMMVVFALEKLAFEDWLFFFVMCIPYFATMALAFFPFESHSTQLVEQ